MNNKKLKKKQPLNIKPKTLKVLNRARGDDFTESEINQAEQDMESLFEIKNEKTKE